MKERTSPGSERRGPLAAVRRRFAARQVLHAAKEVVETTPEGRRQRVLDTAQTALHIAQDRQRYAPTVVAGRQRLETMKVPGQEVGWDAAEVGFVGERPDGSQGDFSVSLLVQPQDGEAQEQLLTFEGLGARSDGEVAILQQVADGVFDRESSIAAMRPVHPGF